VLSGSSRTWVDTWKLSKDPQFIEKVRDVVGLYLDPPEKALVLCVDEKSQMQALDRTAPMLPMMPGVPGRTTHDYIRHGTTSLFAALDIATGKVIGQHQRRHRHQEFLRFLKTIDKNTPAELDLHLICDNYATHKTPAIKTWLAAHPRFQLHFTPTSGSWLNLVERWFAELTNRKLRRSAVPAIAHNAMLCWHLPGQERRLDAACDRRQHGPELSLPALFGDPRHVGHMRQQTWRYADDVEYYQWLHRISRISCPLAHASSAAIPSAKSCL
jgi:transposase